MRRFPIPIAAALLIITIAPSATASYRSSDRDDVPWKPDVRMVDTFETRDMRYVTVAFHDDMPWWKGPVVLTFLDTMRTPRADYVIQMWKWSGARSFCRLWRLMPAGREPVSAGRVTTSTGWGNGGVEGYPYLECTVEPFSNLHTDGTPIRWRAVSYFAERHDHRDHAPQRGSWFPHL